MRLKGLQAATTSARCANREENLLLRSVGSSSFQRDSVRVTAPLKTRGVRDLHMGRAGRRAVVHTSAPPARDLRRSHHAAGRRERRASGGDFVPSERVQGVVMN